MIDDADRRFGGEALAPAPLVDHEREFDLGAAGDLPGQQAAAAEKGAGAAFDRRPQAELRPSGMPAQEPLQLCLRLLERQRAIREVPSHFRIAVERVQRVEIAQFETAQYEA
jgi:hypothetical protein